jgi:hypothetical protein
MNLNRCCSSSSARTRRSLCSGTSGSGGGSTGSSSSGGNTSYRSKKSLKFHTATSSTLISLKSWHKASLRQARCSSPSFGSLVPNQVAAAALFTSTNNASSSTSSKSSLLGEVALAGILALISSATMICTLDNSSPSSCSPADSSCLYDSRAASSDCQFDPGGSDSDHASDAASSTTYATMALASSSSFDQRPSFGHAAESGILHHHVTVPNPKLKTVQSKVTDSSRDRPYDVRVN